MCRLHGSAVFAQTIRSPSCAKPEIGPRTSSRVRGLTRPSAAAREGEIWGAVLWDLQPVPLSKRNVASPRAPQTDPSVSELRKNERTDPAPPLPLPSTAQTLMNAEVGRLWSRKQYGGVVAPSSPRGSRTVGTSASPANWRTLSNLDVPRKWRFCTLLGACLSSRLFTSDGRALDGREDHGTVALSYPLNPPPPPPPTPRECGSRLPRQGGPRPGRRCVVPRGGVTLLKARVRVRRANCSVGRIRRIRSRRVVRVIRRITRSGKGSARGTRSVSSLALANWAGWLHPSVSRRRAWQALAGWRNHWRARWAELVFSLQMAFSHASS
jgi:hypothetical protein